LPFYCLSISFTSDTNDNAAVASIDGNAVEEMEDEEGEAVELEVNTISSEEESGSALNIVKAKKSKKFRFHHSNPRHSNSQRSIIHSL
jgi:hypothetical protein